MKFRFTSNLKNVNAPQKNGENVLEPAFRADWSGEEDERSK
jgi:hypothetical protein